ncbi:winged helix-turn-helix domain-containing protein [Bacillus suaedaesalsae]|uniref:Winged helix-turn-helix transcriptional regulator n=1 Tax=Bacillus suaedaesalsae TaxID=2810349 RepID=A0ABS2DL29_9BACI|nr:winged helix-turn-helix domain-containing protein [Bacillus suaedaesalsae]MBM6619126.1 winged helix-turn-helix transcriptional regulator [Bacillus suaedaesalsae]
MEKTSKELNADQEGILQNPNVLKTFLYLLDGEISPEELSRKTGLKPLEISFHLDRLEDTNLIKKHEMVSVNGRSIHFVYRAVDRDVDLSSVVPLLSPSTTLDLIYNKVKSDISDLDTQKLLESSATIKYAQVKVKDELFNELRRKMEEIEKFIRANEIGDDEEGVYINSLMIGYRFDREN